jgi:cell wall-associated NlpC family hydrolase
MASFRRMAARFALVVALVSTLAQVAVPIAGAAEPLTEAEQVVATAMRQRGDQWKHRARGPNRFDCSGLVWFAFKQNELASRINYYRSVSGYFKWFKNQGKVSRENPQLGDLVVWGNNQHIGIYIGDGMAISTLVTRRGVAVHPVRGYLNIRFKAYLHTDLTRPELPE